MQNNTKLRVLVVEDEPIILRYIAKKVEEASPNFEVVATEENPLQALKKMPDLKPDILLTDIEMPGLNGLDLIEKAMELNPHLSVVIISGYGNFQYAQQALRFGVFDYLLKPIESKPLLETLERLQENIVKRNTFEEMRPKIKVDEYKTSGEKLTQDEQQDLAEQIAEYIQTYFNKPLTIKELEQQFNYTASYINRIFKKKYTLTPIQYQIQLRMNKAKYLLVQHKDADIKDIAAAVGYEDPRYFSRVFRQMEEKTPSEYVQDELSKADS